MNTNRDFEKVARILRGHHDRIQRLEQEREADETIQQVRTVREPVVEISETVALDVNTTPGMVWDVTLWDRDEWV